MRELRTVFRWTIRAGSDVNPRSLANLPMQANGAEILRLACSMLTEAGVTVRAPVHHAVLIEAEVDDIDETVALARDFMEEASRVVLSGFTIGTDALLDTLKNWRRPIRSKQGRGIAIPPNLGLQTAAIGSRTRAQSTGRGGSRSPAADPLMRSLLTIHTATRRSHTLLQTTPDASKYVPFSKCAI